MHRTSTGCWAAWLTTQSSSHEGNRLRSERATTAPSPSTMQHVTLCNEHAWNPSPASSRWPKSIVGPNRSDTGPIRSYAALHDEFRRLRSAYDRGAYLLHGVLCMFEGPPAATSALAMRTKVVQRAA